MTEVNHRSTNNASSSGNSSTPRSSNNQARPSDETRANNPSEQDSVEAPDRNMPNPQTGIPTPLLRATCSITVACLMCIPDADPTTAALSTVLIWTLATTLQPPFLSYIRGLIAFNIDSTVHDTFNHDAEKRETEFQAAVINRLRRGTVRIAELTDLAKAHTSQPQDLSAMETAVERIARPLAGMLEIARAYEERRMFTASVPGISVSTCRPS